MAQHDLEDKASELFYKAARDSWRNKEGVGRIMTPSDDFTGVRYSVVPNGAELGLGANSDGIGTKADVAQRLGKFDTLGYDLVAMICEDAARVGAHPMIVTNTLEVNRIFIGKMRQLASGLANAAKEANVAVVNGEIAVHGESIRGYGDFGFGWSGTCSWLARRDGLIDGSQVHPGDSIVTLREPGFRANGFTRARGIMREKFGERWHDSQPDIACGMLEPSRIYTRCLVSLTGGIDGAPVAPISGMAHITGGGIFKKLGRALKPSGLGAELRDLFEPSKAMREVIRLGNVGMEEAHSTWNMGNGFMIMARDPDTVLRHAAAFGLDAKIAGTIIEDREIRIAAHNGQRVLKSLR